MIKIKSDYEINLMRIAGNIVYKTHQYIIPYIKEGVTTAYLDDLIDKFIISMGAISSIKNYQGFPGSTCISVNDEVVHGIPGKRKLVNGDIVSIDISVNYKGYHGDSAWTYPVGKIDDQKKYLLEHTKEALYEGINQVKPGNYIGDISESIYNYAKEKKLGVVRELVGHGVGSELHEEPEVPNFITKNKGPMLKEGMVIAIEPMLNFGTNKIFILDDDWTIVTGDNEPSAHFEHTVLVTKDGCEILTKECDKNE